MTIHPSPAELAHRFRHSLDDIWRQSLRGRVIDMVAPIAAQVDFGEIAEELSGVYRWTGASNLDISVAAHTVWGCDAVEPDLTPWWLLHDAHEARIGDITNPAAAALDAVAESLGGAGAAGLVRDAIAALKHRHDVAIHEAAGLPLPTEAQKQALKRADLIMLATERRDFLRASPAPWVIDALGIVPLRRRLRWSPKPDMADDLRRLFNRYLPALQRSPAKAW